MDSVDSQNIKICRICQEDEAESGQVLYKPCKCNSHIHKECLLQWIKTKINSDIIDYQNDLQCEVCLSKIRYTHKTTLENGENKFSNIKLAKDMTNFFFRRNSKVFEIILKSIFCFMVPCFIFVFLFGIVEALLVEKRKYVLNPELFDVPDTSTDGYLWDKWLLWINPDYFPTESSILVNGCVNEVLSLLSLFPMITNEMSQEANRNVFYKMYEYMYGSTKATAELLKISNEVVAYSNMSTMNYVLNYLALVTIGIPLLSIFLVAREAIPRYILGTKYNPLGYDNEIYYATYFSLALNCLIYFGIKVRQHNNKPISYKTFVYQQLLKTLIDLKIQEVCVHGLTIIAVDYLHFNKYFALNHERTKMLFQFNPSMESVTLLLNCLTFLRTSIFRNGVFYRFPSLSMTEGSFKKIKALFFTSIPKLVLGNILGLLHLVLAFFAIGGAGIVTAASFKPELFPIIITWDKVEKFILKTFVLSILTKQAHTLQDAVYIPVFQKLAAIFRLSNYLFDYDRPLERGTIIYHESVGDSDRERKLARDSNPVLFKEPCVSEREALHRLEKGNQEIKAYLVQKGYNAKIPNATSIYSFSKDWFKPLNHAGHVIVKPEPEDENSIPEDIEEPEKGSILEYSFPDYESYDICFLPSNFNIRLYVYFFLISLIQNAIVFTGIIAGYKLGDKLYQIKQVQELITFSLSKIQSGESSVEVGLKYKPTATDVATKILLGTSTLGVLIKLATNQIKNSSFGLKDMFFGIMRKISVYILFIVTLVYGIFIGLTIICSATYFFNSVYLLWTSVVYNFTALNSTKSFLGLIYGMFVNFKTIRLFAPVITLSIIYAFYLKESINNALEAEGGMSFLKAYKMFFKDIAYPHFKVWFKFWGQPFMSQMVMLGAYVTVHSLKSDDSLSLLKVRSFNDLNTSLFYLQFGLLLGGRSYLSILYLSTFVFYFSFNIVNWATPILVEKWENWKLITLDNKLGEKDVIILNDQ